MRLNEARVLFTEVNLYTPKEGQQGQPRLYARVTTTDSSFRATIHNIGVEELKKLALVPVAVDADLVINPTADRGHYIDLHIRQVRDPLTSPQAPGVSGTQK